MIAGVDEVGRGPLAGPVVAAAVVLDPRRPLPGLADSKALTPAARERLSEMIHEHALAVAFGQVEAPEIDAINILQATLRAMQIAIYALVPQPSRVLIDGNRCPELTLPATAIVKGDQSVQAISAASIVAKVARDRQLIALDQRYPQYGFARHKGYPTREHIAALKTYGPCPEHRRSFAPVARSEIG